MNNNKWLPMPNYKGASFIACWLSISFCSLVSAAELFTLPSVVTGVSYDGSVLVGGDYVENSYRWTSTGGIDYYLANEPGVDSYVALGISPDGSTIYGTALISGQWNLYTWTESGGMKLLPGGTNSRIGLTSGGFASSYDGAIISGYDSNGNAVYWDANRDMHVLQPYSTTGNRGTRSNDMSYDGSVIVGESVDNNGDSNAVFWQNGTGPTSISVLNDDSAAYYNDVVYGVSSDGSVMTGWAVNPNGLGEAFIWSQSAGMVWLGDLPGQGFFSWADDITADGSVVVGRSHGGHAWADTAFIWTESTGMLDLNDYVSSLGLADIGHLFSAEGISGDGSTIFGSHDGGSTSFVLVTTVPVARDTSASTDQFVATNWMPDVSDADGDALTCSIVSQPPTNQGIASVSPDCSLSTYDPQNFAGPSTSFTYKANDGTEDSNIATVTVTVTPNPAPIVEDAAMSAISGAPKILDLSPYISDGSGDQDLSTLVITSPALNGTAVSNGDGTVTYTSNSEYTGPETFGYTVDDVFGQTSNEGTVSVSVSVGIPPIADPDGPYTGIVGSTITFDGRGSSDLDGRIVSYKWDFGDGSMGTGFKPKHTYVTGGFYTVTLRVTDNDGDISLPATTIAMVSYIDGDIDNDGLPDDVEDANGNGNVEPGETDPFNADTDGDGLTDGFEVNNLGSDPNTTTTLLPGDMNGDGVVNAGDSVLHMREVLGY